MLIRETTMLVLLLAPVVNAAAQQPALVVKEDRPGLLARATLSPDSAAKLAQARLPGATIQSAEIEKEDGRLIYSFEMRTAGQRGIDEVNVDARTGTVLPVEHEGPTGPVRGHVEDRAGAKRKP